MPILKLLAICALSILAGCATVAPQSNAQLKQQVTDTERAFAATMAKRDFAAFMTFISDEAIFHSGPKPLRGKEAVRQWWKKYYEKPEAPFSWEPDDVEVLDSGTLAVSSGPVYDPKGKKFARFNSVWRLEGPGQWRIIFDKGEDICECRDAAKP